jgi:uncharacterized protein with PIN domain
MTDRPIRWQDLEARGQHNSYELTRCPKCRRTIVRRLPENTYHRNPEEARQGIRPLTNCPKCGRHRVSCG